jgi:hypothetical protein
VRFRNVTTTVVTKDLNLGSLTHGTEDNLAASIAATIPISAAALTPSLSASSKVSSSMQSQLLRQLDQRSAYVSPDGAFLRITQRGMSSVNLNGRFNEDVQLSIPPTANPFYVIEPDSIKATSNTPPKLGFKLKALNEPIYSHVDALVVSVAVVRHPTQLRRSSDETFGLSLDDAADEDFIVGLARPSKVRLWSSSRQVGRVCMSDLDSQSTNTDSIYFDSPSLGLYEPHLLRLGGFTEEQSQAFLGQIANSIRCGLSNSIPAAYKNPFVNNLVIGRDSLLTNCISVNDATNSIAIRIGLLDETGKNKRLKGFSSMADTFPSFNSIKN